MFSVLNSDETIKKSPSQSFKINYPRPHDVTKHTLVEVSIELREVAQRPEKALTRLLKAPISSTFTVNLLCCTGV